MEETLVKLGLNPKETELYLALLKTPKQTAQELSKQGDIKRTNIYRLLEELTEKGLVVFEDSPVRRYITTGPQALQALLKEKQTQLKETANSLSIMMPDFRSQYSLSLDKPGVFHMAGTDGFERLLQDSVSSATEVLLVASDDTPEDKKTLMRFRELLLERKKSGVKTRALFHNAEYSPKIHEEFSERGIEVRFIGNTPFKGEVVIYEDNTTFTVYDPSIIVTIVTNKHIANTMRTLFEELWEKATPFESNS